MKHKCIKIAICSCFFILATYTGLAQEIIDNTKFRASYLFLYKTNPEQTEYAKTDLMYLDIGGNTSKFYSQYEQIRDSVTMEGINQGLSPYEIIEKNRYLKKGAKSIVYKLMMDKKIYVTNGLVDYYCYEEQLSIPIWVVSQSKKEIAGYVCREATTNYLGRKWTVCFTQEIPLNHGPWKLWGLPGLIVEAFDEERYFHFLLQGFETLKYKMPLILKKETLTGVPYTTVTKREFQKLEKLFYTDFVEFTRLFIMEGKGTIFLDQEQKYQQFRKKGGLSYIPLEPY